MRFGGGALHFSGNTLRAACQTSGGVERLIHLARNRQRLTALVAGSSVTPWPFDGGWSALLRVPRTRSEEAWVLALLKEV